MSGFAGCRTSREDNNIIGFADLKPDSTLTDDEQPASALDHGASTKNDVPSGVP